MYKYYHKTGYVEIARHTYEHRYVFEQYHKCCLLSWGEVHHRNGIKHDNRIENLEGMVKKNHKALHMIGNQYNKKDMTGRCCSICGSTTTYIKPTGWPQWFEIENGFMCRKCRDKRRIRKKVKK
jgi:hypothetical protein